MNFETRKNILNKVYELYDSFSADLDLACKKGCSACCTCNVTMTSLEGYGLLDKLKADDKQDLLEKLKETATKKRFQPKITVNHMADLCSKGEGLPEEEIGPDWGSCPLLSEDKCPVYEERPFECRSFCSKVNCQEKGFADMDPFVISVNNLFRQYIEHVDMFSITGNLTDMLLFLESNKNREFVRGSDQIRIPSLIPNQSANIMMIPPEHSERIQPILQSLQQVKIS